MIAHWLVSGRQILCDFEIHSRLFEDSGDGHPRLIATNRTTLALTSDELLEDDLGLLISTLERYVHALRRAQTSDRKRDHDHRASVEGGGRA